MFSQYRDNLALDAIYIVVGDHVTTKTDDSEKIYMAKRYM